MTALLAIVRKDLRLFLTDRRAVLMQIVAPVMISAFFGFTLSRTTGDQAPAKISVLVVDEDGSPTAQAVQAGLAAEKVLDVKAAARNFAREEVRRGHAAVAVVLPTGFGAAAGEALFRGAGRPLVPLLFDPSHAPELALVRGLLTQHAMQAVSRRAFSGEGLAAQAQELEKAPMPKDRKAALGDVLRSVARLQTVGGGAAGGAGMPGLSLPYDVGEEAVTAKASVPYNGYAHAFAGMSVQFILFSGINMGIGILLDRQRGVWKRVRAARLSRSFVLAAKAASGTLIAFLTLAAVFTLAIAFFGVRVQGSVMGFAGVLLAIAAMASTFGLLIAAVGRTPEAARGVSIFAVLLMVMLGGAWVPTFIFPAWLQRATLVVPARWAVDGLEAMTWRGLPLSSALPAIAALLGSSLLFAALAFWRFDWDAD